MVSQQTLSEADRRVLARWAVDCARHVLPLVEADQATRSVQDSLVRAEAFASGGSTAAEQIRLRMVAFKDAAASSTPAAAAAARSVAHAAAVAHLGAHALGAAAYAVKAVSLANPTRPDLAAAERSRQLDRLTDEQRLALARLPALGTDPAGPLGPGLLSRGILGETIRALQAAVAAPARHDSGTDGSSITDYEREAVHGGCDL